jgi:hypothetical protein
VERFVQSDAYSIYSEKDPHTREHIVFLKVEKTPRLDEWAANAGDVVHNLRSALDHLVWELTIRWQGEPPYPLTNDWTGIEFPIFRGKKRYLYGRDKPKPADKRGVRGSGLYKIRRLDRRFRALFKSLQPFRDGPRRGRNLLQVVHELDLIDKHRALPVLLTVVVPAGGAHPRDAA